jgi:dTMP kinase
LKPDLTLLFDLPVSESGKRTKKRTDDRQEVDRLDSEDIDFYTRVREAYLKIAKAEPDRVKIIVTTGSVEETHAQVKEVVQTFLDARSKSSAESSI